MQALKISFEAIFPFLFYMPVGALAKKIGFMQGDLPFKMNEIVFYFFLPMNIFCNIIKAETNYGVTTYVGLFFVISTLIIFFASWVIFNRFEPVPYNKGVMIQNSFRSCYGLFCFPLIEGLIPEPRLGIAAYLIILLIPVYNILSIIILQYYGKGKTSGKDMLFGIIKNPLIIAVLSGMLLRLFLFQLPDFLFSTIESMGKAAIPLSLFSLGASLSFAQTKKYKNRLIIAVLNRLVITPFICLLFAVLLGFRGEALACLIAVFGTPTATASYPMSQNLGQNYELAGQIVTFTSAFCWLTLFIFIAVFQSLGFL